MLTAISHNSRKVTRKHLSLMSAAGAALVAAIAMPACAQVITDGTAGAPTTVTGPNYVIPQSLGTTNSSGTAVVQSFSQFDLNSTESADFQGSATLNTIIARVTGGTPSSIDGHLTVSAPNANLYFLNPAGVVFGANAVINVPAGFYVSTADRLNLSDGSFIPMTATPVGTLSTANVASFGFLGGGVGTITVNGVATTIAGNTTWTEHDFNGALSLVASNVAISDTLISTAPKITGSQTHIDAVGTAAGTVAITGAPAVSGGTLTVTGGQLTLQNDTYLSGGAITLQPGASTPTLPLFINSAVNDQNSNSPVTAAPAIYLSGGSLSAQKTQFDDFWWGTGNGYTAGTWSFDFTGDITGNVFQVMGNSTAVGPAYNILVHAHNLSLTNNSWLTVKGVGTYNFAAGTVGINLTGDLTLDGNSSFNTVSDAPVLEGNAGSIAVNAAGNVNVDNQSFLNSNSSSRNGGNISIVAGGAVDISGTASISTESASTTPGVGKSGDITIQGASLVMNNSFVSAESTANGLVAGTITLTTTGNATFNSSSVFAGSTGGVAGTVNAVIGGHLVMYNSGSGSSAFDATAGGGIGGQIIVQAASADLTDSWMLVSSISGSGGTGGAVSLTSPGQVNMWANSYLESIGSTSSGTVTVSAGGFSVDNSHLQAFTADGLAGTVDITTTGLLSIVNNSLVDVEAVPTGTHLSNAGNITIHAGSLTTADSYLRAYANNGNAGTISATVTGALSETNGNFSADAYGQGHGGTVTVQAGSASLNNGHMQAEGGNGNGGSVSLTTTSATGLLSASNNSGMDVSSTITGNGGTISINAAGGYNLANTTISAGANGQIAGVATGGNISLTGAGNGTLTNTSIGSSSYATGQGGSVTVGANGTLTANVLTLSADSICNSGCTPGTSPNGGSVTLNAGTAQLDNVQFTAVGEAGNGGTMTLTAQNGFTLNNSELSVSAESTTANAHGGDMAINGANIAISNGDIRAWNWNPTGQGGNFAFTSSGDLNISNNTLIDASTQSGPEAGRSNAVFKAGGIFSLSGSTIFDPAGHIAVTADTIYIEGDNANDAFLETGSDNSLGGDILLQATNIELGVSLSTQGAHIDISQGGSAVVRATAFDFGPHGYMIASPEGSQTGSGDISVYANTLNFDGTIGTQGSPSSTAQVGDAGNITIGSTDLDISGGSISTVGQTGGVIRIAADNSMALTGGTIQSNIAAHGSGGLDGDVFIATLLSEPTLSNPACDAACAAVHPYSTAWTPGTHAGIPPTYNRDPANNQLVAAGSVGQVIFGFSDQAGPETAAPADTSGQTPAPVVADAPGAESTGMAYLFGHSSEPDSLCKADAGRATGRSTYSEMLVRLTPRTPGLLSPELYVPAAANQQVAYADCSQLARPLAVATPKVSGAAF